MPGASVRVVVPSAASQKRPSRIGYVASMPRFSRNMPSSVRCRRRRGLWNIRSRRPPPGRTVVPVPRGALREGGADGRRRADPCCPPFRPDLLSISQVLPQETPMTTPFDRDAFFAKSMYTLSLAELDDDQRWSTWPETAHVLDRGPQPFPDWVVQHDGAIDTELGILKTGKEADAFLIERALPLEHRTGAAGEAVLLVAKRYRSPEHSTFHRSNAYTEGRRGKDTREARAIARGSAFG